MSRKKSGMVFGPVFLIHWLAVILEKSCFCCANIVVDAVTIDGNQLFCTGPQPPVWDIVMKNSPFCAGSEPSKD
jgi:hypothetical protein